MGVSGELRALKTVPDVDPEHVLRLKDEFRTAADLRHGYLVRLGELVEDGGGWFFNLELVDGVSFTEWVRGPASSRPGWPVCCARPSLPTRRPPSRLGL